MSDLVTDVEWDEISGPRAETAAERVYRMHGIEAELATPYRQLDVVPAVRGHDGPLWAWLVHRMWKKWTV